MTGTWLIQGHAGWRLGDKGTHHVCWTLLVPAWVSHKRATGKVVHTPDPTEQRSLGRSGFLQAHPRAGSEGQTELTLGCRGRKPWLPTW